MGGCRGGFLAFGLGDDERGATQFPCLKDSRKKILQAWGCLARKEASRESNAAKPKNKGNKMKQQDTTAMGVRAYLDSTAKILNEARKKDGKEAVSFHAGEVMKMAAARFAADAVELKGEDRAKFLAMMDATPGWFACGNNSACRQAYERKGSLAEVAKNYGAM